MNSSDKLPDALQNDINTNDNDGEINNNNIQNDNEPLSDSKMENKILEEAKSENNNIQNGDITEQNNQNQVDDEQPIIDPNVESDTDNNNNSNLENEEKNELIDEKENYNTNSQENQDQINNNDDEVSLNKEKDNEILLNKENIENTDNNEIIENNENESKNEKENNEIENENKDGNEIEKDNKKENEREIEDENENEKERDNEDEIEKEIEKENKIEKENEDEKENENEEVKKNGNEKENKEEVEKERNNGADDDEEDCPFNSNPQSDFNKGNYQFPNQIELDNKKASGGHSDYSPDKFPMISKPQDSEKEIFHKQKIHLSPRIPHGRHLSPISHGPRLPPLDPQIAPSPYGPHIIPSPYGLHIIPPYGPHIIPPPHGPHMVPPPHGPHMLHFPHGPHMISNLHSNPEMDIIPEYNLPNMSPFQEANMIVFEVNLNESGYSIHPATDDNIFEPHLYEDNEMKKETKEEKEIIENGDQVNNVNEKDINKNIEGENKNIINDEDKKEENKQNNNSDKDNTNNLNSIQDNEEKNNLKDFDSQNINGENVIKNKEQNNTENININKEKEENINNINEEKTNIDNKENINQNNKNEKSDNQEKKTYEKYIKLTHDSILKNIQGPDSYSKQEEPFYPPYGMPLYQGEELPYPPYREYSIPPYRDPILPPHGAPTAPPHIEPLYRDPIFPPHGAPTAPPHIEPLYRDPIFPPHGPPTAPPHIEPLYRDPIFPPHGPPTAPQHIEPPYGSPIFPPHGPPKFPSYRAAIFPPYYGQNIPYPQREEGKEIDLENKENISPQNDEMGYNSYNFDNNIYNSYQNPYPENNRTKNLYKGNNTILEEKDENKPTLINTEKNKNPEIKITVNEEIKNKEEKMEGKKIIIDENIRSDINDVNRGIFNYNRQMGYQSEYPIRNGVMPIELNQREDNLMLTEIENNNAEINYEELPLYINTEIDHFFIDEQSLCPDEVGFGGFRSNKNSFPIVIISDPKAYNKFIEFIDSYYKYREFKSFPLLKTKLILPLSSVSYNQFREFHYLKNPYIRKFANITSSSQCFIYNEEEKISIIKSIKSNLNLNNEEKYFNEFMDKWIHMVINLMVEFIQFKIKKISHYYYCRSCRFPFLYISDAIEEIIVPKSKNHDDELKTINNSINILDDLMKVMNINKYNNKNNKTQEFIINVIFYEEEFKNINYTFEEEINGTYIPCTSIKSFDNVMNEIHDKTINKNEYNSKLNTNENINYMFELIISEIYIDKVFTYLINSNYFKYFKGICVLIEPKNGNENTNNNTLLQIKKKYANYTKDLYISQNEVILFLKKAKQEENHRNNKKYLTSYPIIDYINYLTKYYNLHQGSSIYYNKYSINSLQIIEKVFLDFLMSIVNIKYKANNTENSKNLKEILKKIRKNATNKNNNENKLFNIIKLLNIIKDKSIYNRKDSIDTSGRNNKLDEDIDIIIKRYTNEYDSFDKDFNYWLNNIDQLAHQKICYFIGSLMYNLDTSDFFFHVNEKDVEIIDNKLILYKELSGNYIDLLIYKKNKNQIITFPSFLLASKKLIHSENDDLFNKNNDKYDFIYKIKYNLSHQEEYTPILFDISKENKLFQLFSFFKITNIKIKKANSKVILDLEPINKKEYLELRLKQVNESNSIFYNENLNIMEPIFYENNMYNDNGNANNSNFVQSDISNSIHQSDISSNIKTSKYLQFLNEQYNTDLTLDQSSIHLENYNLSNIGLLILSKIKFSKLIVLNLDYNKISDLTPLKSFDMKKLKKLSIASDNKTPLKQKISDISPLTNCNFPDLFILNLKNNLISDISYLLFMNLPSLIILDLSNNKIKSIHVFCNVNFPKLQTLDLSNNQINDITPMLHASTKKKKLIKNLDKKNLESMTINNNSIISNMNSNILSISQAINDHKTNVVLPSLKILKIKHNELIIDEGYLMTIKALRNRGVTIFK